MSTMDLFLRVFVGVQVGGVFLIVLAGLFYEFWTEVVRDRKDCKRCQKLAEEPLYVPLAWSYTRRGPRMDILDEPAKGWFWENEGRFEEQEW